MEATIDSLPIFEKQLEAAEIRAKALRQVVEGLRVLNGEARIPVPEQAHIPGVSPAVVAAAAPKGMEAVLAVGAERPGVWSRKQILSEFGRRGWFHTTDKKRAEAAVDAALYRLCELRRIEKLKPGVYRFPAGDDKEAEAA